ncbi:DUF721 domain-containing protein [Salibaculum griseiflavum]|uniref:DUF721 domain-containing protein n=1 Tax=Salibaculum griseiflavum TaxID=1914409 RepID=A0A2V1P5C6_9RHOB|nr:DUF721 domain-containing protein [Salibaculum griseiflavum]PWG16422.1 DUF721 domain-containing protein [Salibaculum griseiflavum]
MKQPRKTGTTRGFSRAATLMQGRIRSASESRGFAVSRLLTHWSEIVGEATAKVCHPVKVSYAQGGMGATLSLLTSGAQAPMLEMQKAQIREKVNACYGYNAIARIHITQTAPTGFAEGQLAFDPAPKKSQAPDPSTIHTAQEIAGDVGDDSLRLALEALGTNVLSKRNTR